MACPTQLAEQSDVTAAAQYLAEMGFEGIELPVPRSEEEARLLARQIEGSYATPCNVWTHTRYALAPGPEGTENMLADLVPSMRLAKLSGAGQCQWCPLAFDNVAEGTDTEWQLLYERVDIAAETATEIGCTLLVEALAPGEDSPPVVKEKLGVLVGHATASLEERAVTRLGWFGS